VVGDVMSMFVVVGGRLGRLLTRASTALLPDRWGWAARSLFLPTCVRKQEEVLFWQSLKRQRLTGPIRRPPEVNMVTVNTDASATGRKDVYINPWEKFLV
jgi:hypothetical protein